MVNLVPETQPLRRGLDDGVPFRDFIREELEKGHKGFEITILSFERKG